MYLPEHFSVPCEFGFGFYSHNKPMSTGIRQTTEVVSCSKVMAGEVGSSFIQSFHTRRGDTQVTDIMSGAMACRQCLQASQGLIVLWSYKAFLPCLSRAAILGARGIKHRLN